MARPTVAKAPSRIPQDVQLNIIELAILKNSLEQISAAYLRKQEEVTRKLTGAVRSVRL
jgi:hypothetical protein